jgi:hypothetical protein
MSPIRDFLNDRDAITVCGVSLVFAGIIGAFIGNKEALGFVAVGLGALARGQKSA